MGKRINLKKWKRQRPDLEKLSKDMEKVGLLPQKSRTDSLPIKVDRSGRAKKAVRKLTEEIVLGRRLLVARRSAQGQSPSQIALDLDVSTSAIYADLKSIRQENLIKLESLRVEHIADSYLQSLNLVDSETWREISECKDGQLKRLLLKDVSERQHKAYPV